MKINQMLKLENEGGEATCSVTLEISDRSKTRTLGLARESLKLYKYFRILMKTVGMREKVLKMTRFQKASL